MIVIIAGSRQFNDPALIDQAVAASGLKITEVIHGAAEGIDTLAAAWAQRHQIPVRAFPANWAKHGRAAGPLRNTIMLAAGAGALLAVWDGVSRGTKDIIRKAHTAGLPTFIFRPAEVT